MGKIIVFRFSTPNFMTEATRKEREFVVVVVVVFVLASNFVVVDSIDKPRPRPDSTTDFLSFLWG